MNEQAVTIRIPQHLYKDLEQTAKNRQKSVEELILQVLQLNSLSSNEIQTDSEPPNPDGICESVVVVFQKLVPAVFKRMERLRQRHNRRDLNPQEYAELEKLVAEYERAMLANSEMLLRINQQELFGGIQLRINRGENV